ncbi:hypothetical protein [Lampropedia cohaerens]|nr:hypothetical protein [Lampropedia cohaerens]
MRNSALAMDTANGILFATVKNGEDAADAKESVVRVHWQPR